jgi:hypothetical protein
LSPSIEEFVVNWFRYFGLGFRAGGWLELAMATLLAVVGIALLELVISFLTPERDEDESEREYWRIHGG